MSTQHARPARQLLTPGLLLLALGLAATGLSAAEPRVDEVWVARDGALLDFVIRVGEFAVVLDAQARVSGVELRAGRDSSLHYDMDMGLRYHTSDTEEDCELTGLRLDYVSGEQLRYEISDASRVEAIGPLRIESDNTFGKYRITAVGCVTIDRDPHTDRITRIGAARFTYDSFARRIERIDAAVDTCAPAVRIYLPVEAIEHPGWVPDTAATPVRRVQSPYQRKNSR